MSDDTPTERFETPPSAATPPASGTSPAPPTGPGGPGATPPDRQKRSRRTMITLLIIGGVVLVAILITAGILVARSLASPAPTATPVTTASDAPVPTASASAASSPTPTATPSPTTSASGGTSAAPPAATGPSITFFRVNGSTSPVLYCDTSAPSPAPLNLSFTWSSKNVSDVYFGVGTTDAQTGSLFSNLPASGDNSNFPDGEQTQAFPCPQHSQTYTLTVVGGTDGKVSSTVTVVNKGDQS